MPSGTCVPYIQEVESGKGIAKRELIQRAPANSGGVLHMHEALRKEPKTQTERRSCTADSECSVLVLLSDGEHCVTQVFWAHGRISIPFSKTDSCVKIGSCLTIDYGSSDRLGLHV